MNELSLSFYSNYPIMVMNVFNGLENLEYLKIYAHLPNWESIVFEGLSFANLKHLTEIKLDGIALTSISDIFFCQSQQLKIITLTMNYLNFISIYGLRGLNKLKEIVIYQNQIETINLQSFVNLPYLTEVDLSSNRIE